MTSSVNSLQIRLNATARERILLKLDFDIRKLLQIEPQMKLAADDLCNEYFNIQTFVIDDINVIFAAA